jgi:hypothetical protein
LEIEIGNPSEPNVTEKIDLLVDSGAIYSVVPTLILEKLNIKPLAEQEFRLANGTKIIKKKGAPSSDMRTEFALQMSSSAKKATATF